EGVVIGVDGKPAADVLVMTSLKEPLPARGRIVDRARTDEQGRFRLQALPDTSERATAESSAIWAYRPGSLAAVLPVRRGTIPSGVPLQLVLGPPAEAIFEVRDSEGASVAGVSVIPTGLTHSPYTLPEELSEEVARGLVTDARGKVVVSAFLPEELSRVEVHV